MNKLITIIILTICFLHCSGGDGINGSNGLNGTNGAPGIDGTNGVDGEDGEDGLNGQDAILSSGIVGSRVNDALSACHYDFLYLSNGWLLFRHQANGTADEGSKDTGFNLRNIDITNFTLESETKNKTYCTLVFDKVNQTLSYTVVYTNDGKQGETGLINL